MKGLLSLLYRGEKRIFRLPKKEKLCSLLFKRDIPKTKSFQRLERKGWTNTIKKKKNSGLDPDKMELRPTILKSIQKDIFYY